MMRVLVTGGHGYIGGRFVRATSGAGALQIISAGRRQKPVPANVESVLIDWSNFECLAGLCRRVDAVVHLAALNEAECEKNPQLAQQVNVSYTSDLLQAAIENGVRRFVDVSTSKVFGANPAGVLDEKTGPSPVNEYAKTHRQAEELILRAHAEGKIQGVVLRLSNAVGAPISVDVDAWSLIGNDLCRQAATSGRIVLKSSGLAWRNFIAMGDVTAALQHALKMPEAAFNDGLFHLGGAHSLRIKDFAQMIAARAKSVLDQNVAVQCAAAAPGEDHPPLEWRIDRLMATGWRPRANLDDEIDGTLRLCLQCFSPA